MKDQQQAGMKRRYKAGQWVQYDGLYSDDWGDDLILVQGDLFPTHPSMGDTNWTYVGPAELVGPSVINNAKSPKWNSHFIGY